MFFDEVQSLNDVSNSQKTPYFVLLFPTRLFQKIVYFFMYLYYTACTPISFLGVKSVI